MSYKAEFVENNIQTQSDDMSNWETYRNEEYGFEFKYPSDYFEITTQEESLNFMHKSSGPTDYTLEFRISMRPSKEMSLESWIKTTILSYEENSLKNYDNVVGGKNTAIVNECTPHICWTAYYTFTKSGIFSILVFDEDTEEKELFTRQILSTFRFLDDSSPTPSIDDLKMKCNVIYYDRDANQTRACP